MYLMKSTSSSLVNTTILLVSSVSFLVSSSSICQIETSKKSKSYNRVKKLVEVRPRLGRTPYGVNPQIIKKAGALRRPFAYLFQSRFDLDWWTPSLCPHSLGRSSGGFYMWQMGGYNKTPPKRGFVCFFAYTVTYEPQYLRRQSWIDTVSVRQSLAGRASHVSSSSFAVVPVSSKTKVRSCSRAV